MTGDLEGILVVAIEQAVAAPYASRLLADAGARVVKVERAEGDFARSYDHYVEGESANFVWLNRGKESVRLDLKAGDDLALLRRMIARADVLIQNLAPGATARLGLGAADLREQHPRLITCDISGYGETGPYRDLKAYDLLVQAESGLAWVNGIGDAPTRVGISVCDIAGGITAAAAIFRALFARERTGQGRAIQVSLFHAIGDWMNVPYLTHAYGGHEPQRLGLHHPTIAPYGAYPCRDGKAVLVAIQNEREWVRLCREVLERSEVATDPRFASNPARVANRAALDEIMRAAMARLDRDEAVRRLEAARIAYGRLSTLEDLAPHPQSRFVPVVTEGERTVQVLAPGAIFTGISEPARRIPRLGEHDAALRAEFGRG